jgi:glycine oxidase
MGVARVAGAGVVGLSCALALSDAGFEVEVWDPAPALANASGVAAGMLAPAFEAALDPAAAPHFDLLLAARNLWPAFADRSGVQLDRAGALAVGSAPWIAQLRGRFASLGLHPGELSAAVASRIAPGLSGEVEAALFTREDWRLDAVAALGRLRQAAERAGVRFVQAPVEDPGASLLVVATGASRSLEALAPEIASLSPIKGHILRLAGAETGPFTVRGEGVYLAPGDGAVLAGATMEAGVSDPAVDPAKAMPLQAAAARLFPDLAAVAGEAVAGVRGATSDGLPLAGWSRRADVLLAVGARRNGWLLAPLVAQTIAALATGRDPGVYASRLAPDRFTRAG